MYIVIATSFVILSEVTKGQNEYWVRGRSSKESWGRYRIQEISEMRKATQYRGFGKEKLQKIY